MDHRRNDDEPGQHHERQPLLGRERIGVQKFLDAAEAAGFRRVELGVRGPTGRPVTAAVSAICSSSATDVSDSAIRTAPDSR